MSRTSIWVAGRDGVVHLGREFSNAWGGAWFIWSALWGAYLEDPKHLLPLLDKPEAERIWALAEDLRLPEYERITLVSTFDHCMVRRHELLTVASAFEAFVAAHERRRGNRACNLPLQALYLRELADATDVVEVGWNQTSVNAGMWHIHVEIEQQNGTSETVYETLEDRPYSTRRDTAHWFLFDRYPELRPAAPLGR